MALKGAPILGQSLGLQHSHEKWPRNGWLLEKRLHQNGWKKPAITAITIQSQRFNDDMIGIWSWIINQLKLTNLLWPEFPPIPIWQWLKIIDPTKNYSWSMLKFRKKKKQTGHFWFHWSSEAVKDQPQAPALEKLICCVGLSQVGS